jgi:hypothetical protein
MNENENDSTFTSRAWRSGLRRPTEPVVLNAAEPVRLTGTKMDAVTAGAVAYEWALGPLPTVQHLHLYQHLNKGFQHAQRQC